MLRKLHVPNPTLGVGEALTALARPLPVEAAERACERILGEPHAVLFASARAALAAAAASVAGGRTVTLPAYTCIAVPNAMRSAGVGYRFVDVGADGLVTREAWDGADVALVQDTYGFAAEQPAGVTVIRDCAHRVDLLSSDGVAVAVTSFEHSKWLSAGRGGLAVTADAGLAAELRRHRDERAGAAAGALRHGLSTLALLLLGRVLFSGRHPRARQALAIAGDLLSPDAVAGQSGDELHGQGVGAGMLGPPSAAAARMIVGQLSRAGAVAAGRAHVAAIYDTAAGVRRAPVPLVRYPMLVDDVGAFERALAAAGWDAEGRWFDAPLHPRSAGPASFGYRHGSAPRAEALAAHVVNLPTHPLVSDEDARALIAAALGCGARPLT